MNATHQVPPGLLGVQIRQSLFASDMTSLKTGAGKDGVSGAFVFQTGRRWANDSTILYAEFSRMNP
jgi:hypothetical protein